MLLGIDRIIHQVPAPAGWIDTAQRVCFFVADNTRQILIGPAVFGIITVLITVTVPVGKCRKNFTSILADDC